MKAASNLFIFLHEYWLMRVEVSLIDLNYVKVLRENSLKIFKLLAFPSYRIAQL
jgi:predicted transcriptional regulator with HTH domain